MLKSDYKWRVTVSPLWFVTLFFLLITTVGCNNSYDSPPKPTKEEIKEEFHKGNYSKAERLIGYYLMDEANSPLEKYQLSFLSDKMKRIRRDFRQKDTTLFPYIEKHYPEVTEEEIAAWEASNAIENLNIDGEKFYFNSAGRNLFRISEEAAQHYKLPNEGQSDSLNRFLKWYVPKLISKETKVAKRIGYKELKDPVTIKVTYSISVNPDEIPAGEMVRVWMPYPRTDVDSHSDIKLLSTSQPEYIISPDSYLHKSIYMEQEIKEGEPANFSYQFVYTTYGQNFSFKPEEIKPYDTSSELYQKFTQERAPHMLFEPDVASLAKEVVGDETNPYLKVKKIYEWIDNNFPWASAREYSTICNIPQYVLKNRHGDCGQVALLLITMARSVGVPAKWQSGWMMHPGNLNLHDWAEVYYEGVGWVPVDVSFGRIRGNEEHPDAYYFLSRGLDPYRLIVNQDISAPFFPGKIHPRSETVDFQRGEVEWRGENLYFGRWRYRMNIEYL